MSSPNNPFLPLLTQENNNNNESRNQDNNETKDNGSNTLEEGSSVSAPPPAYEDVVKPGYNYQHTYNPLTNPPTNPSYPPPSYPPPPPTVVPMTANVNQTNPTHPTHANHGNKYGYRVCCFKFSSRGKACCYALIILIVFVILASISIANNSVCRQLVLEETPRDFFVDPQNHTGIILFEEGSRMRTGGVRILQNPSSDQTSVNIKVFTGNTKNVSPQFKESTDDRGNYNLVISKKSGFNLFNIPPHCMIFRIDVYLPQNVTVPSIRTDNMNIKVMKSDDDKPYQNIPLITVDGDIEFEAVNATSVEISTDDGNIFGLPSSKIRVSNNLSVKTDDGDLSLSLDVTTNSTVSIQTKDGNVKLNVVRIDGSQVNCRVRTEDRGIEVNGRFQNDNMFIGTFGTADDRSPANLTITTEDGDVDLSI